MIPKYRSEIFQELTEAFGPSGFEDEIREVILKHLPNEVELSTDNIGSLIVTVKGDSESPKIMLAAHMDEVGFMVSHITTDGFLHFVPIGGWWAHVMLAQRVIIRTRKGDVPGFIGAKAPQTGVKW
jgi:endoglucanase